MVLYFKVVEISFCRARFLDTLKSKSILFRILNSSNNNCCRLAARGNERRAEKVLLFSVAVRARRGLERAVKMDCVCAACTAPGSPSLSMHFRHPRQHQLIICFFKQIQKIRRVKSRHWCFWIFFGFDLKAFEFKKTWAKLKYFLF